MCEGGAHRLGSAPSGVHGWRTRRNASAVALGREHTHPIVKARPGGSGFLAGASGSR
jgi:hypothetical protein